VQSVGPCKVASTTHYVTVKTMQEPSEAELSREIISDLQEGIEKLEEERDILNWRIEQKRERLRAYQAKLGIAPTEPSGERKRERAPRGANLKTILALLQDPTSPRQGLSSSEIVTKTKLSFSSVQAALRQGVEADLVEQVDSFWRPKTGAKPAETSAAEAAARNGTVS
jgi:chromosome segregation ATPase